MASGASPSNDGRGRYGVFASTHWSKLLAAGGGNSAERRDALNWLLARYWKPVYCYIRRCGYCEEDAKDLVQEFFTACLGGGFFGQADPARGRFRNFLLGALKHFLANHRRAVHAQKRQPAQGLVSLDQAAATDSGAARFEPADPETPEAVFYRAWVADLALRVLRRLEAESRATGKQAHYELLRQRLALPALEGLPPPPLCELAGRFGLSEKQAANCLLTARRAYRRLLKEEIRTYAESEDEVSEELGHLLAFLGWSGGN